MIDFVDRAVRAIVRSPVALNGKHMEVWLWAPKARRQRPSATRGVRGRAGAASVTD